MSLASEKPGTVGPDDVNDAAVRIAPHIRKTPVIEIPASTFGLDVDATIVAKLEYLQCTGAFKARGAFNRLVRIESPERGVIAASGGNHGAGVAYAAQRLGIRAEIFVPATAPIVKIERLRAYGATVVTTGETYAEAKAAADSRAEETGAAAVHAYDEFYVVAGQGTIAKELEEQTRVDAVLVAVGGGGLIGGIAAWYSGRLPVIGVETDGTPTLHSAIEAGGPVDVRVSGIAADSLGAGRASGIAFALAERGWIDRVVLVGDDDIRAAQRALWSELRIIAEPGGAAALAGLLAGAYIPKNGERIGVILCGANTDPATIVP